jgi:CRP/FNR family transcriptional regulator, cyclic AMP receptor protein
VAPAARHPVGLPVQSSVVDLTVADAVARSFLAKLPPELVDELMADGERSDYPAGTRVYRAGAPARAQLVIEGLLRVYLSSAEGRQVTVRYARDGDVLGIAVIVGGPVDVGVQTVVPSSLFSINPRRLTQAGRQDARVAWAVAEELAARLDDTLQQAAMNTFGSVRQRVAFHLLDLASDQQRPRGRLEALVSQQELADAVGSVREVVARTLRDLRLAGIVATSPDRVLILDPARLHGVSWSSTAL